MQRLLQVAQLPLDRWCCVSFSIALLFSHWKSHQKTATHHNTIIMTSLHIVCSYLIQRPLHYTDVATSTIKPPIGAQRNFHLKLCVVTVTTANKDGLVRGLNIAPKLAYDLYVGTNRESGGNEDWSDKRQKEVFFSTCWCVTLHIERIIIGRRRHALHCKTTTLTSTHAFAPCWPTRP